MTNKVNIGGIIGGFKADTYFKAFILGSLVLSLTTIGALYIHDHLYYNKINNINKKESLLKLLSKIFILFFSTFIIGLLSYIIMFYLFGFGQGMLVNMPKSKYNKMVKTSILKPISIKK